MNADRQPRARALEEKSLPDTGGAWCNEDSGRLPAVAEQFPALPWRVGALGLNSLPEVEVIRHFTELSQSSHGVDNGSYPLGSCTMKYNPKSHDFYTTLDGFRHIHPKQPAHTLDGLAEMYADLQEFIAELTGVDHVSLQPAAGAHGELAGLLIIRKFMAVSGQRRNVILIADSAHGTNPSSAAMAGFNCKILATTAEGLLNLDELRKELRPDVAGLMLTNPSTLGLFEENILEIAELVHANGSLLYYDGANMNALMGICRPGDMGFDIVHINTHKTLSTPHGGGGPGAGPVGVKSFLRDYLPTPIAVREGGRVRFVAESPHTIGQMKSNFGHTLVLLRAYAYMLAMGPDGLREASENAVLNANYVKERLRERFPPVFDKLCMHECLLSGQEMPVSIYGFAKRLIDHGLHPPTLVGAGCVYYPDRFRQTMLIEPTETETKYNLDQLVSSFLSVYAEAIADRDFVDQAPHSRKTRKVPEGASVLDSEGRKSVNICVE
jgi:glycine dehydrogenase subunit 2